MPVFAQKNWQCMTSPKVEKLVAGFKSPPPEYTETVTFGLEGPLKRESVIRDLDAIHKQGIRVVSMEAAYKMAVPYLSVGWFDNVKIIVEELKKRDMRLWIIDEGKYPSSFAGGKFSRERPDLRMQRLVIAGRAQLKEGETIAGKVDTSVFSVVAITKINTD
ncbi:hypothetical protein [Pedobacter sp. ok626]|uniref:hypothetical protein n=1 Tax=Pedobacter sp. ok626 TaxID=1761882 RepID=UPI00104DDAD8|nr:hypothetical protein [Pedobacter sp. ok626]